MHSLVAMVHHFDLLPYQWWHESFRCQKAANKERERGLEHNEVGTLQSHDFSLVGDLFNFLFA